MNKTIIIISLFFILGNSKVFSNNEKEKTYYNHKLMKSLDIVKYLKSLDSIEILQLERLCAYFFHQKINEHRIINQELSWLSWNEDMWIAARNHNIYMLANEVLSHSQQADSEFFTGVDPNDRYKFVTSNSLSCGENCLYFTTRYPSKKTLVENAYFLADRAFENWRNSPGHNRNMLNSRYNMHGTAFYFQPLDNHIFKIVFATTVFGYDMNKSFEQNEIQITWDEDLAEKNKPLFVIRDREVYSSTPEEEFISAAEKVLFSMTPNEIDKNCATLNNTAGMNLEYMKANKISTIAQQKHMPSFYAKTTKRRYLKSAENLKWYNVIFKKLREKTEYIEFPLSDFLNPQRVMSIIEISTSRNIPHPSLVNKWGYEMDFYKNSDHYVFVIDVVYILK